MKKYDEEKMRQQLLELKTELTYTERTLIAGMEKCTEVTVSNYLKGNVYVPALADAIIRRGNEIVKTRLPKQSN